MPQKGKAEYFIEDVAGCGPFQFAVFFVSVVGAKSAIAYSIIFMSFGNYNPGWRCLDNTTTIPNTSTGGVGPPANVEYSVGSCDDYEDCDNVEFNPETTTVVTEFGLLCDKEWISSAIISFQMVGMLIGSLAGGQLSDFFGRKKTFFSACAICAILQLLSSFSVSWVMLAVIRFFLGVFDTFILVVLYINIVENMTLKWRAALMSVPFWYVGCTIQALVSMGFKDWRNVELTGSVLFAVLFIPVFWIPENLRWLEVKGKTKEFMKVSNKIVKCNGKDLSLVDDLDHIECYKEVLDDKKYTVLDMFRPGYKFKSACVGVLDFVYSMIYYALTFGIKSLYGDFYINMIVVNVIAIPMLLSTMIGLRYASRTALTLILLGGSVLCSLAAVGCLLSDSEDAKATGTTVLISIGKGTLDAAWLVLYARVTEMYPTVIRSTALGFASLSARVGGILAPFVIPNDKSNVYIFIAVSAGVILLSCLMQYKLPETKGVPLKETFDDGADEKEQYGQQDLTKDQEMSFI